jgi:dipeptidyl-peptidase-4
MSDSFPRLWARTRRFTLGEPRGFEIVDGPDGGTRVLFLRALAGDDPRTGLWALDVPANGGPAKERLLVDPTASEDGPLSPAEQARRERVRESATGVVGFSLDRNGRRAVTRVGGRVVLVDVDTAAVTDLPVPGDAYDPRIDPTGRRVAYVSGQDLYVADVAPSSEAGSPTAAAPVPVRVAGEDADRPDVYWGRAEHAAAEEMGRTRGFWWAADGDALLVTRVDESTLPVWWMSQPAQPTAAPRPVRFPAAGGPNAHVSLWRVAVPDGPSAAGTPPVRVRWDAERFEYLAAVSWPAGGAPVIAVQSRDQRRVQWLEVGPDADTRLLAEDTGEPWVELHPGAPAVLGADLVRIADVDGHRHLLIGDRAVSPPSLHLRSIAGVQGDAVVVTASGSDPGSVEVWRFTAAGTGVVIADQPGVHIVAVGDSALVLGHRAPTSAAGSWSVLREDAVLSTVENRATPPPLDPHPDIFTTASGVRVGILLPSDGRTGDLPVLMYPYGGPHGQRVTASGRDWLESQWWADQGFAVVVADGRGTPGVSVAWEHAVHLDVADTVLTDQVEALAAAADRLAGGSGPRLDLTRVGIRGWSFGGFLAALAVLRRPDVFHAAVAGAPPTDWRLYDTHYTERYLGTDTSAAPYRDCSLLDDAARLERPLLLVHGMADDNVVVANTLLLSQRLTEAGRPHSVLPLSGVTHMTPQESVAENLLLLQRDFLLSALG